MVISATEKNGRGGAKMRVSGKTSATSRHGPGRNDTLRAPWEPSHGDSYGYRVTNCRLDVLEGSRGFWMLVPRSVNSWRTRHRNARVLRTWNVCCRGYNRAANWTRGLHAFGVATENEAHDQLCPHGSSEKCRKRQPFSHE